MNFKYFINETFYKKETNFMTCINNRLCSAYQMLDGYVLFKYDTGIQTS